MEGSKVKIRLRHVVLLGLLIFISVSMFLRSDYYFKIQEDRIIRSYLEEVRALQDYRDEEGYVEETVVETEDRLPDPGKDRFYRSVYVKVIAKMTKEFEELSPAEQCRRVYKCSKDLAAGDDAIRESSGYEEVLRNERMGRGMVIFDARTIRCRAPVYEYFLDGSSSMVVMPPGTIGYSERYSFRVRDGKVVDVKKEKYSSGGSGTSSAGKGSSGSGSSSGSGPYGSGRSSSSGRTSSSGRSSSSGRGYYDDTDSYDVYDYDDPDDFADDWADDFADLIDSDYEDGYDEAYEYWEDHH